MFIENGKIKSITKRKPTRANIPEIKGKGKYLIPGLINMYTHVNENNLWLYLANGQTAIKDAPSHLTALGLRDKIEKGELIGPRIFAVGLRATGMPAPYPSQQPIRTAEEGIMQVRETKRLGYDGMFIYGSCDKDTYQPIIDEADKLGLHISGHFPQNVDLETALNTTQKSFDNLTGVTRHGRLRLDKEQFMNGLLQNNQAITPTLTVHKLWSKSDKKDSIYSTIPKEYIPHKMRANWLPVTNGSGSYPYKEVATLIKEMHDRGIQLFIGSDGGFPLVVSGFSYHDEIENFSDLGISNAEILKMATVQSADFLGYEHLGLVKEGYEADLVLLDKNPLKDLKNLKTISHIVVRGKPISKSEIDQQLVNLRNSVSNPKDRFAKWQSITNTWKEESVTHYKLTHHGLVVGEERVYLNKKDNRNFTLSSINVMDGPDARESYLFARINNKRMDSLYIESRAPEGIYQATITTTKTKALINGTAPYHGDFEYEEPLEPGTLLIGPFTSRYFEMDLAANYVLAMQLKRTLQENQADQLPVIQIELNNEEYGKNLIVDNSDYTVLRLTDNLYKIIYNVMSGYRTLTTSSNVVDISINDKDEVIAIKQGSKQILKSI
ncbi:MAG: hypothetical protein Tsb004_15490 [Allomuricauda sp.]